MSQPKASIRGAASTSGGKDLETMVEETGQIIERMTETFNATLNRVDQIIARIDPDEMTVRDLRDIGYILAVIGDKRQLWMEQKAQLEGTNEHTQAAIGKQLEGIAAIREELIRRQGILDQRERDTVDVTEEMSNADQGTVAREEPGGSDQPEEAAPNGARQPVPKQRRQRPAYVPYTNGRPRGPRI